MKPTEYIWKNGSLIRWEEATTHVMSHALHYGTGVFEGIRAYSTPQGPAIFRAKEHFDRLIQSAHILLMKTPYSAQSIQEATCELIRANKLQSCYIRPILYYGYGKMGLFPGDCPIDTVIAAWEWGTYLGAEGLEKGIKVKISSWARLDSRILPPLAKSTANYLNSAIAKTEALQCGYDEALLLNVNGSISEGPGENIFVIKNGELFTPPASDCALQGITAQSVMQVAQDLGYKVSKRSLIRDDLFTADELFFTGTAAEVTPIRDVDGRQIGNGARGPITRHIQDTFFDIVAGKNPNYSHWLTLVN